MTTVTARERLLAVMRQHPDVTWTRASLSSATGIPSGTVRETLRTMHDRGDVVRPKSGAYVLLPPTVTAPASSGPAPSAGPCPTSDALLRLMRSVGGKRTQRGWAALWMERESLTVQTLGRLAADGLVVEAGGQYAARGWP